MISKNIEVKLAEIRRLKKISWILFFTYVPAAMLGGFITNSDNGVIITAGFWLVLTVFFGLKAFYSKCPRCGNSFYKKGWFSFPFAQKCLHCKLRIRQKRNETIM